MSIADLGAIGTTPQPIVYPESDGMPMADNTVQLRHIVTIYGGLSAVFRNNPNIFIAADLLWYPIEGNNKLSIAPDVMAARRPKGDRGSYLQWVEGGVPPHVVFEIRSPNNTTAEMERKFQFYERYGVEEYYLYDPERGTLVGWLRNGSRLVEIPEMNGWISPALGIRFELVNGELKLYGPDDKPFETYEELARQQEESQKAAGQAQQAAVQAEQAAEQAQQAAVQAQQAATVERHEKERAQQEEARQRERAERLAAQLRALGVEPQE